MLIDILGTEYKIICDSDYLKEINADGICKEYDKEIVIRDIADMLTPEDKTETKELREKEVLRHELIHAFFSESGLDDYSGNEQLVNWLAIQFPKMIQAFREADAL